MINPNKIHSVEISRTWERNPTRTKTNRVIINQINPHSNKTRLYYIEPVIKAEPNACMFHIDVYISNTVKAHSIRHIPENEMYKFIADLQGQFERGRYLFNNKLHRLPNAMVKNLSYKDTRSILRYEKLSSKFLNKRPMVIQTGNPKHIETFIDCGEYFLEVFNKSESTRSQYAYSTFNKNIDLWLKALIS